MDETLKKMIDYIRVLEDNLVKLVQENEALKTQNASKEDVTTTD